MRTSLGWAPEIPDHWEVVPLNAVARIGTGHTPDRSKPEYWEKCTIPWVTIPDAAIHSRSLSALVETSQKISEVGLQRSAAEMCLPGTVMLSRTASVGYSLRVDISSATTQDFVTWECGPRLNPTYLLAVLRSMAPEWDKLAFGSTHRTIYMPDLESIRIPLPSREEQDKIASYVTIESSKIDQAVEAGRRLQQLATEYIDSQLSEIVGDSTLGGSQSIGLQPIKRILQRMNRCVRAGDNVVTAFRDGQVVDRSKRAARGYTLSSEAEPQGQGVEIGDVVVHGLDGFSGAIGDSESEGNCSSVYHVCSAIGENSPFFQARMLRVLALGGYLPLFATSTRERAVDFRNWQLFGSIPIPEVPKKIQQSIAEQILASRPLKSTIARSISTLEEKRLTLLTSAVTGAVDIATARGAEA